MNYLNPSFVEAQKARLEKNNAVFHSLVAKSRTYLRRGQYQHSAVFAEIAAYHATWHHNGLFASYELEEILWSIARQTVKPENTISIRNTSNVNKVLHIASMVSGLAGLQHLLRRWIEHDGNRCHSVAVSQPSWDPVPERLNSVVTASGGSIELVGNTYKGIIARAQRIRKLAIEADLIVLHMQTEDVAPIIGLSQKKGIPPVVLVNHADHAFWIGATAIDLIVNLRSSGLVLCRERRGIEPERLALLPTPLDQPVRKLSREEAKSRLGLPINAVVLLSVARPSKYNPKGRVSFPIIHVPVLQKYRECFLIVVGPEHNDEWEHASRETDGRIKAFGLRFDTTLFYQAADIYVDAFPMVSITSLLEAGSLALPLVSLCLYSPKSAIWCADAPGLDQHLIRCQTIDDYRNKLCYLIEDTKFRIELGRSTQEKIAQIHVGENWIESLEAFYESVKTVSREPDYSFPLSQRNISEPDLLMPELLSDGKGLEHIFYNYRKVLPLDLCNLTLMLKLLRLRTILLVLDLLAPVTSKLPFKRPIKKRLLRFAKYFSSIFYK